MVKCKTGCNKSCRSCCKDSKTFGFVFFLFFYDFLGIFKVRCFEFMAFLRLAPWTSVSSPRGSLDGEGTEEVGRSFSRRGEAPAAWDRWGRGTRRSSRTCWWPWLAKRWSEAAPPRPPVAGGDGAHQQRRSGGQGVAGLGR